jgi:hypothetical protein
MDQHPVPRNVTGFKFQLIGFMTLRQFLYILFGLGFGFVFFKAPIGIIRFPMAGFCVFVGIAFAFLPIQERPLEVWVVNFFKIMFSPTEYAWVKEKTVPLYLAGSSEKTHTTKEDKKTETIHQDTRTKLEAYLASTQKAPANSFDVLEKTRLDTITGLFNTQPAANIVPKTSTGNKMVSNQSLLRPAQIASFQNKPLGSIVGGAVVADNKPLSGALIHVFNKDKQQVRLLKTNNQGKFISSIPLVSGKYSLNVEDPGKNYRFTPFEFLITDKPLPSWIIKNSA